MLDDISKLSLFFTLVPVVAFLLLVRSQYLSLQKKTYRLTVLNVRAAFFLPLYALFIFFSVIAPKSYVLVIVVVTIVEGYSFYCFLAMITTNLGGPAATVDLMYQSQRKLFCSCCCPSDSALFFQKTTWAIFHLFITRSILSVFSAICFYSHTDRGKAAYVILNSVSAVMLFYGVICLVNLYENVFEHCTNLFGVVKLILLKISVGAIVVQGLVESFLYSSGTSPFKDDDTYDSEEKTLRAYCLIVLGEFVLMSFVYYYAFGWKVISSSPASYKTPSGENLLEGGGQVYNFLTPGSNNQDVSGSTAASGASSPMLAAGVTSSSSQGNLSNSASGMGSNEKRFPFSQFLCDVLRFHDIVGVLTYKGELYQPVATLEED